MRTPSSVRPVLLRAAAALAAAALGALAGCTTPTHANGGRSVSPCFPLWYYASDRNGTSFNCAAGLFGCREAKGGYRASWFVPFWYEDNEDMFVTAFYGRNRDATWYFPFYYRDRFGWFSPVWGERTKDGVATWASPLALAWGATETRAGCRTASDGTVLLGQTRWSSAYESSGRLLERRWWCWPFASGAYARWPASEHVRERRGFLADLVSWETENGDWISCSFWPLFTWTRKDGAFKTLLFGWDDCGSYVTPLAAVYDGPAGTGSWVLPFGTHARDVDFAERRDMLESARLPETVAVITDVRTNRLGAVETRRRARGFHVTETVSCLMLAWKTQLVRGEGWNDYGAATNRYVVTDRTERFIPLILARTDERRVTFDLDTRARLGEEESATFRIFGVLFRWTRDARRGTRAHFLGIPVWWRDGWAEVGGDAPEGR